MRRMTRVFSCSLVVACAGLACACSRPAEAPEPSGVTVFEGARLITGDGSAAIENSAFIVENARFTQVGRRGEVTLPAGAVRTDLTGKTVMPAMVDLHGHLGFQNVAEGTMSKETFTRESHRPPPAARLSRGGRRGRRRRPGEPFRSRMAAAPGDVPLKLRDEVVPDAALFRTAGPGIAWQWSGAQGHPSRMDVSYPVATVEEARAAVQDYVLMKPAFIKIWVDDRGGTQETLTPSLPRDRRRGAQAGHRGGP